MNVDPSLWGTYAGTFANWEGEGVTLPKPYYEKDGIVIYNADCRDILPLLPPVDLVLTDPPYGVGRHYGPAYDDSRDGYWEWFTPCFALLRQAAPVVAMTHRLEAMRRLTDWDWVACWHKPYGAGARIGNSPILPHWEPILLWGIHTLGCKRPVLQDVITCNPERSNAATKRKTRGKTLKGRLEDNYAFDEGAEHPLPKPIALFRRLVERLTYEGGTVLDPFMGSGTTLRAAKDLGRRAIGIEIEEKYCEIAVKRLAQEVLAL